MALDPAALSKLSIWLSVTMEDDIARPILVPVAGKACVGRDLVAVY